uniref:Pod-specific dehydrogenase n=1 Tax=Kwoniella dejecticola CBS 10117 TaxID=1296121 RepID=A0A1A6A4J7_9TREE|nr:pod-specific dehydrogenase [Kwoniella dejecticola CBS 10117]OBR84963.1 pod-specific dehydrogenase [Kwoniella dejecticola CBS 10117]
MGLLSAILSWIAYRWDLIVHSGWPGFFWVRPGWSVDEIPDQSGRVVLITGGNSGTGYATALAFYNAGAKVYIACRNEQLANEGIKSIQKGAKKGTVEFIKLDLADLGSVDSCAEEFLKNEKKLDILFANAGVMASPEGLRTKQGYTLQFGTNVLGHHRLISLLLPLLLSSPPTHPSRIILTSSAGHATAPKEGVDLRSVVSDPSDPVQQPGTKPKWGKYEKMRWVEYGQSKWGNIALSNYLHNEYGRQGRLISVAVHPGLVATNLGQHLPFEGFAKKYLPWLVYPITRAPAIGAVNQVWAATVPDEEARWLSGQYIVPFRKVGIARADLQDDKRVEKVWNWCDEQGKKWA